MSVSRRCARCSGGRGGGGGGSGAAPPAGGGGRGAGWAAEGRPPQAGRGRTARCRVCPGVPCGVCRPGSRERFRGRRRRHGGRHAGGCGTGPWRRRSGGGAGSARLGLTAPLLTALSQPSPPPVRPGSVPRDAAVNPGRGGAALEPPLRERRRELGRGGAESCPSRAFSAPLWGAPRRSGPSGELLPGRVPALHGHGLPAARRSDTASGVPRSAEGRSPDRSRCRSRPSARCRRSPSVVPPGWTAGAINWFFTPANLPTADSAARGNAARLVCIG